MSPGTRARTRLTVTRSARNRSDVRPGMHVQNLGRDGEETEWLEGERPVVLLTNRLALVLWTWDEYRRYRRYICIPTNIQGIPVHICLSVYIYAFICVSVQTMCVHTYMCPGWNMHVFN